MSSLLTNTAAMTALQTLRSITQSSPPRKTASPPASASPPLRTTPPTGRSPPRCVPTTGSRAVQDALGLGAATIDTDVHRPQRYRQRRLDQIKAKLVAARTPGVDRTKIQSEITEMQQQLKNTADARSTARTGSVDPPPPATTLEVRRVVVLPRRRHVKIDTLSVSLDSIKLYDAKSWTPPINAQAFPTADTAAYDAATDVGGNITVHGRRRPGHAQYRRGSE